jgi:ATP-dependent DNA helicase RecG
VTKSVKQDGDILVGTQALLNKKLDNLGLLVIDEQHRFGVRQRSKLLEIKPRPHLLSMTATPIPRTLALTLYAHLDLSSLDDLPGRQIVKTWLVPQEKRSKAYDWINSKLRINLKPYCLPLINPRQKNQCRILKILRRSLKFNQSFNGLTLDLIHGRLKRPRKTKSLKISAKGKPRFWWLRRPVKWVSTSPGQYHGH